MVTGDRNGVKIPRVHVKIEILSLCEMQKGLLVWLNWMKSWYNLGLVALLRISRKWGSISASVVHKGKVNRIRGKE